MWRKTSSLHRRKLLLRLGLLAAGLKKAFEWSQAYNSQYYGNYDDVLNSDIDVYISLPISLQEEWCIKEANKGINIICEKSSTIFTNRQKDC